MRAGEHQSRILRTQVCTCLFGNTGLRTQQIQAHVLLGHRGNKALGKFNAGYLTVQLFTEDLAGLLLPQIAGASAVSSRSRADACARSD